MNKLLLFLAIIIVAFACENSNSVDEKMMADVQAESEAGAYSPGYLKANEKVKDDKELNPKDNRKIIWKGEIELQVKDVDSSTGNIKNICDKYGAFISDMDYNSTNHEISNSLKIRINNNYFNQIIDEIKKQGIYVKNINISSNDVTEEYIDIISRLKTKREVRDRYIKVLRDNADSVKDIIAAEEAIRQITEEIEAKEGRLRYLKDKINFSTINLNIYQKVEYEPVPTVFKEKFSYKLKEAFSNGWQIIVAFTLFLINIWPLVILIVIVIWKRKWLLRKFRN